MLDPTFSVLLFPLSRSSETDETSVLLYSLLLEVIISLTAASLVWPGATWAAVCVALVVVGFFSLRGGSGGGGLLLGPFTETRARVPIQLPVYEERLRSEFCY